MKSVMDHSFGVAPAAPIQRSSFDRSHGHKTTFDFGKLVPVFVDEALPGDTMSLSTNAFGRLNTPINPVMDNMFVDVHYFSVPCRLLWDNWKKFMGEQVDPGDSIDYTIPTVRCAGGGAVTGSFEDYIGIPIGVDDITYNALFYRAYQLIYNEWYRDQNLVDTSDINTGDTQTSSTGGHSLFNRGKRHDYFTSCLTAPQKGDAVSLPLGTSAPVIGDGTNGMVLETALTTTASSPQMIASGGLDVSTATGSLGVNIASGGTTNVTADLTNATAATINELRQAFQVQKLLERDARSGTRYAEIVLSHFGVRFYDPSYRPEFLGGGTANINVNPVAQTSSTDATTPQGNLSAFGTTGISGIGFNKSFNEHCIVIGLASARADLTYQQGLNRMFSRSTRYDFYWPALSNIGEQSVLSKEIYSDGTPSDEDVFGYQERYAEYRYKPSIITGKFRSDATGTLDAWHLAQDFSTRPTLNQTFIEEDPPIDRVVSVTTEPDLIFDFYFQLRHARPMPVFGIPGMIDHF